MNVGNPRAADELQIGVLLEELHHPGAGREERVDLGGIEVAAEFVPEVRAGKLGVLDDAFGPGQRIARHPHPPAGPGGSTAHDRVLFHHDDLQSVRGGSDGGREPRGARPDDQQVACDLARRGLG